MPKVSEGHDADIEKNLSNASSQLLKYLDHPHVEEDLRVELKKLESMLGSKTPSHDIAITKNIRKIKIRLAVLDSLRDVKDIIASGKLNATGAQVLGYMLIATTSYKNHDLNFITRLLGRFTEFMKNNPIKSVATPAGLYLIAVFLANCFILSELAALAETKLNAETNELGLNTNEVLLQAAKDLGVDLSTTTYDTDMAEFKKSSLKVKNALFEIKKIEDAEGNLGKQQKISMKQLNKLTKEEKEVLYKEQTPINKLNIHYYEHKTKEKIPEKSIIVQAIYNTLNDGLAPLIGKKMPEFVNNIKEAAVVCNSIRFHVNIASEEIVKNQQKLSEMTKELNQKIDDHVDHENQKSKETGLLQFLSKHWHGTDSADKANKIDNEAKNKIRELAKNYEEKIKTLQIKEPLAIEPTKETPQSFITSPKELKSNSKVNGLAEEVNNEDKKWLNE
ncbi:MAG: hypothetical protein H0U49_04365 [Parachlamydiaceae bacterium]|nr:hypothetical protein [Parachlamydiaceae bacterium]